MLHMKLVKNLTKLMVSLTQEKMPKNLTKYRKTLQVDRYVYSFVLQLILNLDSSTKC